MQNCGMPPPPPFVTWAESLSTQKDRIWVKTFFFGLHLFWAGKRTDSEWRNFSFGLHYFQISCPHPPFESPAYATKPKFPETNEKK